MTLLSELLTITEPDPKLEDPEVIDDQLLLGKDDKIEEDVMIEDTIKEETEPREPVITEAKKDKKEIDVSNIPLIDSDDEIKHELLKDILSRDNNLLRKMKNWE